MKDFVGYIRLALHLILVVLIATVDMGFVDYTLTQSVINIFNIYLLVFIGVNLARSLIVNNIYDNTTSNISQMEPSNFIAILENFKIMNDSLDENKAFIVQEILSLVMIASLSFYQSFPITGLLCVVSMFLRIYADLMTKKMYKVLIDYIESLKQEVREYNAKK
jgi:hypothetical protein